MRAIILSPVPASCHPPTRRSKPAHTTQREKPLVKKNYAVTRHLDFLYMTEQQKGSEPSSHPSSFFLEVGYSGTYVLVVPPAANLFNIFFLQQAGFEPRGFDLLSWCLPFYPTRPHAPRVQREKRSHYTYTSARVSSQARHGMAWQTPHGISSSLESSCVDIIDVLFFHVIVLCFLNLPQTDPTRQFIG